MNKENYFLLGKIAKLHGYKGEVSLFLDVTNPDDYTSLDAIFIDINNRLVPFFIESIKRKNNTFVSVKLEGVDSENDARPLLKKNVYLPEEILPKLEGTHFYDHEVIGFTVFDLKEGQVGEIKDVIDFKTNPLLQIYQGEKEILVPLIEGLVKKIDRNKKEMHIDAPEGLIQMYLNL